MKNKQQSIDDMTIAIHKCLVLQPFDGTVMKGETAERLVNTGYGNIPQALTEFAEQVIYKIGLLWNINGNNGNVKCAQEMVRLVAKDFGIDIEK